MPRSERHQLRACGVCARARAGRPTRPMASGERQSQLAALATVKRLLAKDSERTSFWRECFREADADNNSVLDKEEARVAVGEFIRRIYKCGDAWQPSDKKIDRIFVACDV